MVEESLIGGGLWLLRLEEEEFSSPVSMGEVMGEGEGRRKEKREGAGKNQKHLTRREHKFVKRRTTRASHTLV
jgi:hypothetical protein